MKTIQEIQAEARQLTVRAQEHRSELALVGSRNAPTPSLAVLARFPEPAGMMPFAAIAGDESLLPVPRDRYVDAVVQNEDLVFRLVERWAAPAEARSDERPVVLVTSSDAFEVLHAGYELAEEERLADQLTPFTDRERHCGEGPNRETVAEVESILETNLLPIADRIRTKAEIVEFLGGRMEANELIARSVGLQCVRESHRQAFTVRQEHTLTIGEP